MTLSDGIVKTTPKGEEKVTVFTTFAVIDSLLLRSCVPDDEDEDEPDDPATLPTLIVTAPAFALPRSIARFISFSDLCRSLITRSASASDDTFLFGANCVEIFIGENKKATPRPFGQSMASIG